jgi:phosphoribosylformimino-5-aminoimidazole carboxamide ribotide isomerase
LDGKAVRLEQGDYERLRVYDSEPIDAARRWVECGADRLHVVDLDGARDGKPVNLEHLGTIASQLAVPIQYGGGLRSFADADRALGAGAARVVLGTTAFKEASVLEAVVSRFGAKVAVSVDVRGGRVATDGWIEQSTLAPAHAIKRLRDRRVSTIIYTNVDRDGTLEGVDPAELEVVAAAVGNGHLIWSGGVGSLDDLRTIGQAAPDNLRGVIVGKALYERRFTVDEARDALS